MHTVLEVMVALLFHIPGPTVNQNKIKLVSRLPHSRDLWRERPTHKSLRCLLRSDNRYCQYWREPNYYDNDVYYMKFICYYHVHSDSKSQSSLNALGSNQGDQINSHNIKWVWSPLSMHAHLQYENLQKTRIHKRE